MLLLGFVKRNFVCESKFSWWLFQLVVVSRFCLKTLPLNTPLFEETVFEKSQVYNLSRFKISICIWWRFVRVRTFEITEWVFARFFSESTVIKFWSVNMEIKSFSRKSKFEGEVSYSKMNTLLFCVFTFRVDLWNVFFCRKWKVPLSGRRQTICSSFKINTTSWVLHSKFKNVCVLFVSTMICFCFFFDGKNDRCRIVVPFWDTFNIEIDCSIMRLGCLDELVNN
jgi:hypothetical protein